MHKYLLLSREKGVGPEAPWSIVASSETSEKEKSETTTLKELQATMLIPVIQDSDSFWKDKKVFEKFWTQKDFPIFNKSAYNFKIVRILWED